MIPLLSRARDTISKHQMLPVGSGVLVSVSGGPDSMALLQLLLLLREEMDLKLRVIHFNHGLRGAESDREEAMVMDFACARGLEAEAFQLELAPMQDGHLPALQEKARNIRYQLLEESADRWQCSRIALGHQANDQAETILHNFLRGSGLEGLSGMPYRRGRVVRPLLDCLRSEIEFFLEAQGISCCTDSSNLKPVYRRNHLRLRLIPWLEKYYNPRLVEGLNRQAEILREEDAVMDQLARQSLTQTGWEQTGPGLKVSIADLLKPALGLRRRMLRLMIRQRWGDTLGLEYDHLEKLLELAANPASGRTIHLSGGLQGRKEYAWLLIEAREPAFRSPSPRESWSEFLKIPGWTVLPQDAGMIEASLAGTRNDPGAVSLDLDRLPGPLLARPRKNGDRFYPAGGRGSKKVKDFLIDRKIPRDQRERLVIVEAGGEICWLAGLRADERFLADQSTRRALTLSLKAPDNH